MEETSNNYIRNIMFILLAILIAVGTYSALFYNPDSIEEQCTQLEADPSVDDQGIVSSENKPVDNADQNPF